MLVKLRYPPATVVVNAIGASVSIHSPHEARLHSPIAGARVAKFGSVGRNHQQMFRLLLLRSKVGKVVEAKGSGPKFHSSVRLGADRK